MFTPQTRAQVHFLDTLLEAQNEDGTPTDGRLELFLALGPLEVKTYHARNEQNERIVVYAPTLRNVRFGASSPSSERALELGEEQQQQWLDQYGHVRDQLPAEVLDNGPLEQLETQEKIHYTVDAIWDLPSLYVGLEYFASEHGEDFLEALFEALEEKRDSELLKELTSSLSERLRQRLVEWYKGSNEEDDDFTLSDREQRSEFIGELALEWQRAGLLGCVLTVSTPVREYSKGDSSGYSFSEGYRQLTRAYVEHYADRAALHADLNRQIDEWKAKAENTATA